MEFSVLSEFDRELPVYVTGVGIRNPQNIIERNEGFYDYQILLVDEGKGIFEFNGEKKDIEKGYVYFIPKNIAHKYYPVSDNFATLWVSFDGKNAKDILKRFSLINPCTFNSFSYSYLKELHNQMYQMAKDVVNCDNVILSTYLYRFLAQCCIDRKSEKYPKSFYIYGVKEYLLLNCQKDISLDDICSKFNVAKSTLCRDFKKTFSTTILDYVIDIRIQLAKSKISENHNLTIKEIAKSVGFNDCGYFIKVFKSKENITPVEFRNMINQEI